MGKCVKCGKSGLFLKVDKSGLCPDCSIDEERQRRAGVSAASDFVSSISAAYSKIPSWVFVSSDKFLTDLHLGNLTPASREEILGSLSFLRDNLPRFSEYPYFDEAFRAECVPDSDLYGYIKHSHIRFGIVGANEPCDYEKKVRGCISDIENAIAFLTEVADFETLSFKVVGVTFKNGRRQRQTILREIYYRDPPYSADPDFRLEKTEYEGEPAFAVFANDEQVGSIAKEDIPQILERWGRYQEVSEYSLSGGGEYNFGLKIAVKFSR